MVSGFPATNVVLFSETRSEPPPGVGVLHVTVVETDAPVASTAATSRLKRCARRSRLADAIIVTDGLSPSAALAQRIATMASSGARGHLLLIADPIEETFPFTGQAELFDLEDGLTLRVGDAGASA